MSARMTSTRQPAGERHDPERAVDDAAGRTFAAEVLGGRCWKELGVDGHEEVPGGGGPRARPHRGVEC